MLLIEVSDSNLPYDRDVKVVLYAESGIAECWLVDLAGRAVEVYRQPDDSRYTVTDRVGPDTTLDIATLPGFTFPVSDLFRPSGS